MGWEEVYVDDNKAVPLEDNIGSLRRAMTDSEVGVDQAL
jgi:hypothetical protein